MAGHPMPQTSKPNGRLANCELEGCDDFTIYVTVTYRGEQHAFCSPEHAALWLLQTQYPHATRLTVA